MAVFIMFGCTEKKSIHQMDRDALVKSSYRTDSIAYPFRFGMTREKINYIMYEYSYNFYFAIDGLLSYNFKIYPIYFNDSLMRLRLANYQQYGTISRFKNSFSIKYGNPDTTFVEDKNIHYIWYQGNKKIELEEQKRYEAVYITYTNLLKDTVLRVYYDENCDKYTSDYYNNVYLPRKKESIKDL